ncbi:MAG: FKBP-type peptidyl-prolyl cis-trans isomerase [Verrucomicrobiota bacterium]|jgi:FKBP-type peptidyl-prolyl cis-trans isomerase
MKRYILAKLAFCGLALNLTYPGLRAAAQDAAPKTDSEKFGYAYGMYMGASVKQLKEQMKSMGVDMDTDNFLKGLKDSLAGGATLMTTNEVKTILNALETKVQAQQAVKMKELGDKNIKTGQDFLDKNKSLPDVKVLPDGVQYKIIKPGDGPKPKLTDTVIVNYRGTFVDGQEFDASQPGSPRKFAVNAVIPGWTEILQLMPTGSKWQAVIPSDKAYGPNGRPGIPPNATLIFDVELLSIEPPPSSSPAVKP